MQDYLATVQSVDDSVGRCSRCSTSRASRGTRSSIYTSDQGFFLGDHGLFDKRFMYEESIRMPFLVRWPARIKPGTRSDAIALNIDFAPTFLDAAGLPDVGRDAGTQPVARSSRPHAARTGARRCTTATTTTPATTTRERITACARARTS